MTAASMEIDTLSQYQSEDSMRSVVQAGRAGLLNADEVYRLAVTLANSGNKLTWEYEEQTADLVSTGGPSSLSTLLVPLYLRSLGFVVPKLGVPGRPAGGIDVLAQLPGYRTRVLMDEIKAIITKCGYVHFLAGEEFAPLDAKFFSYRQKQGAQNIPSLVSASLLAKKIACGIKSVGVDVRVASHGNFGRSYAEAKEAFKTFFDAAAIGGIKATGILTDGRFPYQPYIGRGESLAALKKIFAGQAHGTLADHRDLCRLMAGHVAHIGGVAPSEITENGIEAIFYEHIVAQGSSVDAFERKVESILTAHNHEVRAKDRGFLSVDLASLRGIFRRVHSNRQVTPNEFADSFGVILCARPGSYLNRGDLLATVRASTSDWEMISACLENTIRCVELLDAAPGTDEVIYG